MAYARRFGRFVNINRHPVSMHPSIERQSTTFSMSMSYPFIVHTYISKPIPHTACDNSNFQCKPIFSGPSFFFLVLVGFGGGLASSGAWQKRIANAICVHARHMSVATAAESQPAASYITVEQGRMIIKLKYHIILTNTHTHKHRHQQPLTSSLEPHPSLVQSVYHFLLWFRYLCRLPAHHHNTYI